MDKTPFDDVLLGIGARGPIFAKDKAVKIIERGNNLPGNEV